MNLTSTESGESGTGAMRPDVLLQPRPTFLEKVLAKIRRGRLWAAVRARLHPWVQGLAHLFHDPAAGVVTLHAPALVAADPQDRALVERIFHAYGRMKADQEKAGALYQPSPFWQRILADAYADLLAGLRDHDVARFHYFLQNFGAWPRDHAVESTVLIRDCAGSFLKSRYLRNAVFHRQLDLWKWFYDGRQPVSRLSYPTTGNQAGAYINGVFVGPGSFFNEIHGTLLSGLLKGGTRPVVAELGAGYGKFAWFILRDLESFAYVDLDLPETLCLAAYYMMKAFPDKRALLYGEEEFTPNAAGRYDLIFLPCYDIHKLAPRSVDLFLNKNSLGEMREDAVHNYTRLIARATKWWFFHMNHDVARNYYSEHDEQDRGLLGYEYPMPPEEFRLLFRYPDMGHLLMPSSLGLRPDIFLYLYERRSDAA